MFVMVKCGVLFEVRTEFLSILRRALYGLYRDQDTSQTDPPSRQRGRHMMTHYVTIRPTTENLVTSPRKRLDTKTDQLQSDLDLNLTSKG
jgi:hypothetical protein